MKYIILWKLFMYLHTWASTKSWIRYNPPVIVNHEHLIKFT
jgi:hypothetical protein